MTPVLERFDQRSLAMLCSQVGAVPLIAFGLASDSFVFPGKHWVLSLVGIFTLLSIVLTVRAGKLNDQLFAIDGFGGMLGIAASAAVVADDGSAFAVLVLIAAVPALAAMASPQRIVVGFVIAAMGLACAVVAARATSTTALAVGGGAVLMAIAVPTIMVTMLRRTLSSLLDEQARLSITDPLTGALNRRGLFDGAAAMFRTAERTGARVAMLVVDIDHFKRINDTHGHTAGDAVLILVTDVLRDGVGDDSLVARTGGEEFTVLMLVDDEAQLRDIASRLCVTVHASAGVTISVGGVSALPHELDGGEDSAQAARTLDQLVAPADHLLYSAKHLGRNRSVVASIAEVATGVGDSYGSVVPATFVDDEPDNATARVARTEGYEHDGRQRMVEILHPYYDAARIAQVTESARREVVDMWPSAIEEFRTLDALEHIEPGSPPHHLIDFDDPAAIDARTRYVVIEWRNTVVRMPDSDLFYRLKTARNRFLLTSSEQAAWRDATVAVAGLSVGSSALASCALTGARRFHIADSDRLSATNLNRMSGSICDVGLPKIDIAQRRILEGDPYSSVTRFAHGYSSDTADDFLGISTGRPVSVVIEEIDDIALKIDMRRRARAARIPVVSVTDIGENVMLDIERYDLEPDYPIFHGRGENVSEADAADPMQRLDMAMAIVGDNLTSRMAFSASQVGRGLASWPQLGSTAAMSGGLAAAAARNIVCGRSVASGRYVLDIERMIMTQREYHELQWNELTPDVFAEVFRQGSDKRPAAPKPLASE
ncbi:diguanylate cyclase [Gordonia aichiensis]